MFHLNEQHAESRVKCLVALGKTQDPSLVTRFMDWALYSGDVRDQDLLYALGTVSANRKARGVAWTYIQVSCSLRLLPLLFALSPSCCLLACSVATDALA